MMAQYSTREAMVQLVADSFGFELSAAEGYLSEYTDEELRELMRQQMEALVSDRLYIPPYPADSPGSESLNAAVATAITIAEFRRRK